MPVLHSPLIWLYQSVSQNSIAVMLNQSACTHMSDICICIACLKEYHFNSSLNGHRVCLRVCLRAYMLWLLLPHAFGGTTHSALSVLQHFPFRNQTAPTH